jgi:putative ABC transport system permease protein
MLSLFRQIVAVTAINVRSISQRFWLSLSTVVAIALVVVVLLAFLAMGNGFRFAIASAGSDDVAVILRGGSQAEIYSLVTRDQLRLIQEGPGIAQDEDGKPIVSPELYLSVEGIRRSTQAKANLPLRGIGQAGVAVRKGIHIIEGRMFHPGANEIVVGKGLSNEFQGFEVGKTVTFRDSRWTVVGIFGAGGSVFESEIWGDLPVVQSLFKRNNIFQTIRVRLQDPSKLDQLASYVESDPRLKLDVKSEAQYFAEEASRTSDFVQKLGWPLAIAMAVGALAGALNTTYSSVSARSVEIATLRAIGFSGISAFAGTLLESIVLAAIGGAIGAVAALLIFNGLTTSTVGASFTQVVFSFKVSPALVGQAALLAFVVGVGGGLLPGISAARMSIVTGLHR